MRPNLLVKGKQEGSHAPRAASSKGGFREGEEAGGGSGEDAHKELITILKELRKKGVREES